MGWVESDHPESGYICFGIISESQGFLLSCGMRELRKGLEVEPGVKCVLRFLPDECR